MSLQQLLNQKNLESNHNNLPPSNFQTPIDQIQTILMSSMTLEDFSNRLCILLKKNPSLKQQTILNQSLAFQNADACVSFEN